MPAEQAPRAATVPTAPHGPLDAGIEGVAAHMAARLPVPFARQLASARTMALEGGGSPALAEQYLRAEKVRLALDDAAVGRVRPALLEPFPAHVHFKFAGYVAGVSNDGSQLMLRGPDTREAFIDRANWTVRHFGVDAPPPARRAAPGATALQPLRSSAGFASSQPERLVALGMICLTLLAIVALLLRARRGAPPPAAVAPPGAGREVAARLAELEQAVETVAVEVERIGEGQRYSARLLSERLPDAAASPRGPASRP